MQKRGLINETGGAILWVIILVVLMFVAYRVFGTINTSNEENQAQATLERFGNFLLDLNNGQSASFIVYNPKGFYFVPSGTLICICDKTDCKSEKSWCKNIDKPLDYSGNPIKINIGTFRVINQDNKYLLDADIIQTTEESASDPVGLTAECSGELVNIQGFQLKSSLNSTFEKAVEIAKSKGFELQIVSAFRTEDEQRRLWVENGKNSTLACNPDNTKGTCPHQTGCAVDVCIGDLCYKNRPHTQADMQTLEQIMTQAGFVRYQAEYWHFEYGTSRWQTCKAQGKVVCI